MIITWLRADMFVGLVVFGFLCSSCAFRPDVSEENRVAAETFTPPQGKGLLYVYRPSTIRAAIVPRPVFVNDQHLSSNSNGTFMAIPLKPGKYRIQAAAQGLTEEFRKAYPEISLELRAGQNYFVSQTVEGSIFGSGETSLTPLQTRGVPIVVPVGTDLPPFAARVVSGAEGRASCSKLKQIGADPFEYASQP